MIPIYPVNDETCKPLYGRFVYVVLQDGAHHIGVLSRIDGKQLILNEQEDAQTTVKQRKASLKSKKPSIRKTGSRGKARLSAVSGEEAFEQSEAVAEMPPSYPNPYTGERVAVSLSNISMLFLLD